ncbi:MULTISPECIES: nitroreductase family protein [Syntrophotalea]|uniref:Nitroreductase n=2 Tax=Syntrophotalea TaxID=2812025 RepID=A0A1L3GIB7_SYNAC|nr:MULTISPECIES: nitroreductase family protein [Syntrophotalea]APG25428.1 nitroreductase [Syntrophotalea acetylenica]APG26411.1 nitroreductase [Syntrophotalea acetylenivorans]APG43496.1 nitroreductase [Syntrophotalea acetylenica]
MCISHGQNSTLVNIEQRRSIRSFTDKLVPDEHLMTILRAANQAPSAHNQQSWKFIVIRGKRKNELVGLVGAKAGEFPRAAAVLLRMAARSINSAPVVIVVANTGKLIGHGTELFQVEKDQALDFFKTMEIQSSAAAIQNLLVAAASLGLATVWLGILFLIKDEVLRLMGEQEGEFMAVVPLGYAAKDVKEPKKINFDMMVKWLE